MILLGQFVDVVTGEVLGYKIGNGDILTAAVTKEKAKELKVEDIEIVNYLDLEVIESIKGRGDTYAVLSREEIYLGDYAEVPYTRLDDKIALYGHVFNSNAICELNNNLAIERLKLNS